MMVLKNLFAGIKNILNNYKCLMIIFNKKNDFILYFLGILVFINLLFVLFFPIYPDEINWRVLYSKITANEFSYETYLRSCGEYTFKPNLVLYPFLKVLNFYNDVNIFNLRVIPLLFFFFSVIPLYFLFKLITNKIVFYLFLIIFLFLVIINGGFFWISSSRPEHFIYLFLAFAFFYHKFYDLNKLNNIFFFLTIFSWFIATVAHPKFLIFLLYIIYIILNNCHITKLKKVFFMFLILFFCYIVYDFHQNVFFPENCNKYFIYFIDWLKSFNLNPYLILTNYKIFAYELFYYYPQHLFSIIIDGSNWLIFSDKLTINLLPNIDKNIFTFLVNPLIQAIYSSLFVIGLLYSLYALVNFKNQSHENKFVLFIFLFIFIHIFFNKTTNPYEISLWSKLLSIAFLYFIYFNFDKLSIYFNFQNRINIFIKFIIYFLILIAFFGSFLIYKNYFRKFINESNHWYHMSTPLFYSFNKKKSDISTFYNHSCKDSSYDFLLFDDHTYSIFSNLKNTFPLTYFNYPFVYEYKDDFSIRRKKLEWFADENKNVLIYASCDFKNEIPIIFNEFSKFQEYNLCCLKNY